MILCAGEALIDMLPRKAETGEAVFAPYPGGSVFNTAIAAARLGVQTEFFTGLSTDLFGERLAAVLTANGVGHSLTARADRPTTLAFVTLSDGGQASYAFYDENTAGRMLTEADLPEIPSATQACFFGGISLAVEPCAAAYAALITRASADHLVMVDPNIRPGFIPDEPRFRARMSGIFARADIVKASDEDLRWIMGDDSLPALAARLLDTGPALVLVTQGANGVTAFWADGELHAPAEAVDVADTVGAGDTFNAGFLAGLNDAGVLEKGQVRAGLSEPILRAALDLGVKAAAVTVSRAGANPPRRDEL